MRGVFSAPQTSTPKDSAMLRMERENAELRARLTRLEAENELLLRRIQELIEALAVEQNRDRQLALSLELKQLQARVNQQNRDLYGVKSEKRRRKRGKKKDKKRRKKTGSKRTAQLNLPRLSHEHVLADSDRGCACGGTFHPKAGRFETACRIEVTERIYSVAEHKRQIYVCGSGCGATTTAPAPAQLVPGGQYDTGIAIQAAVDKYTDHQPLNRQAEAMGRAGLKISRQALWNQLDALATLCEPTYEALHAWMVGNHTLLHADETTWRLMLPGGSAKWWLWSLAADDGYLCQIGPSRDQNAARSLLRDFGGELMTDGYAVYSSLAKQAKQKPMDFDDSWHPQFSHSICWSHARRPFEQASKNDDDALVVLDLIGELFAIEAKARDKAKGDHAALLRHRQTLRQSKSAEVIDKIEAWRAKQLVLPGTKLADGLGFLKNHWTELIRFLDEPIIPLTNNLAERQIRPAVLGRKNHHGSHSPRGAKVAAIFYSLIGSCRLLGVSPAAYLKALTKVALADRSATLLPSEFAATA